MPRKPLLNRPRKSLAIGSARVTFLLSAGLLLMACFESNVNNTNVTNTTNNTATANNTTNTATTNPNTAFTAGASDQHNQPKDSIRKEIDIASLRRSFVFSRNGSIILNIYPIKHSGDMNRKDFELAVVGPTSSHSLVILGDREARSRFPTEYKWYRSYLKKNRIADAITPAGYYLKVEEHTTKNKLMISIPLLPSARNSGYLSALMPCLPDDSCKMPPGPCPCEGLGGFVEQALKK